MKNENDDNVTDLEKARRRLIPANDQPTHEPVLNMPPTTQYLGLAILGSFIVIKLLPDTLAFSLMLQGGVIPARYTGDLPFTPEAAIAPLTHMFIHGGWLHLAINLGTLLAFGAGLEKTIGGRALLALFFLSGLIGAGVHVLFYPHLQGPMIGASGAISGLFGAVLMMMHQNGVMGDSYRKLLPFIAIWIGISLFFGFFGMPGSDTAIAWTTHIGGFLAGIFLYRPVTRRV